MASVGVTATVAAVVSLRGRPEPTEREPREEKEVSPSRGARITVVAVELFIVAVHGGSRIEGRRTVLPKAAAGRVVAGKPSHHRRRSCLCFTLPDLSLSPGEKQNARGERRDCREVLHSLELRCCCYHGRRASAAKKRLAAVVEASLVVIVVVADLELRRERSSWRERNAKDEGPSAAALFLSPFGCT